jgi:hypothetical protein
LCGEVPPDGGNRDGKAVQRNVPTVANGHARIIDHCFPNYFFAVDSDKSGKRANTDIGRDFENVIVSFNTSRV